MRQLTGHDATFLYTDTVHANANVTFVQIYDQSTAPGGKVRFKSILAHIESRLHRSPVFRSRLQRVPLELDYPYWVEDEHFDLEYHVRHIALPKPGDWRQFCIQVSRIHARALDLNRPLWEIYVIEGLDSFTDLPPGSFAMLTKIHHAAIDPQSRNEITEVLHDTTAGAAPPAPPQPWFAERSPGAAWLMVKGAAHLLRSPLKLMRPLARMAPAALAFARDVLWPEHLTATRFNSAVSPHRVFDSRRFLQEEFECIAGLVAGATVDDAVLAVCAGGLRAYLDRQGELPAADLAAIAPARGAGRPGPEVSWMRVELGTRIADPVRRLAWIHRQTSSSQALARAAAEHEMDAEGEHLPAATLAVTRRLLGRVAALQARGAPLAACTVAPVAGPPVPLFLNGARMTYYSAVMPIADGMGLVYAVTRYDGRIVVSPTSCRELMPDPQVFTQCLRDSFQECLARARQVAAAPAARARPARPGASSSGRRSPGPRTARTGATPPRAATGAPRRSTAPRR
jgi:WS/DGAT/MGAT family acyltransferase